ncbi:hypothetical protein AM571_CH01946 [Rhizobium etli 8C-3]|uniref:Uncharacterized protein n=1 Tax=Rhizobium etli 8C-3 TaxID=538025 RepID=A0A1L5P3N8_RHIET|nr:hypothetical protein AM571_CH01946 [Rhizobium etli 8C-3]
MVSFPKFGCIFSRPRVATVSSTPESVQVVAKVLSEEFSKRQEIDSPAMKFPS